MSAIDAIQRIETDFERGNGPFSDVEFPEERLLREVGAEDYRMEQRARIAMIFSTFDYNRDANQLVDNLVELYEQDANLFDPWYVTDQSDEEAFLKEHFEDIGFRYPNRDARGWYKNCDILRNQYNGRVTELMLTVSSNAPDLVEQLDEDGFLYVKGEKIAPMFARILNDEVAPLNNMWQLEIPVDTWVRKITKELTETDMSDEDIRAWWGVMGEQSDISRHVVDGGLWQIGNNWHEWGEEYFSEVTGKESFEYL